LKIAKERENEVEPQTAKEWIKELVIICTYIIEVAKCLQFGPTKSDYINRMITITGGFKKDLQFFKKHNLLNILINGHVKQTKNRR